MLLDVLVPFAYTGFTTAAEIAILCQTCRYARNLLRRLPLQFTQRHLFWNTLPSIWRFTHVALRHPDLGGPLRPYVERLDLVNNTHTWRLAPLDKYPRLTALTFHDYAALHKVPETTAHLRTLELTNCWALSYIPVHTFHHLTHLAVSFCPVEIDVHQLSILSDLQSVRLHHVPIVRLDCLDTLLALRELWLESVVVDPVMVLRLQSPTLRHIVLDQLVVVDVRLYNVPCLQTFVVRNMPQLQCCLIMCDVVRARISTCMMLHHLFSRAHNLVVRFCPTLCIIRYAKGHLAVADCVNFTTIFKPSPLTTLQITRSNHVSETLLRQCVQLISLNLFDCSNLCQLVLDRPHPLRSLKLEACPHFENLQNLHYARFLETYERC